MSNPSPVFILGSPRSGTTLFSLLLKQQPQLAIPYESHFIVPVAKKWGNVNDADFPGVRQEILDEIFSSPYVEDWHPAVNREQIDLQACDNLPSLIEAVFQAYAKNSSKERWGDKTPGYLTHADTLHQLFPNGKFIHLVRDGRDASLSLIKTDFGPNNFLSAIQHWQKNVTIARKMLAMLDTNQQMEIRYEDLVQTPEPILESVCHFLDLEYTPGMLENFSNNVASGVGDRVHTHHNNLLQPINSGSCQKWKQELGRADQHLAWKTAGHLLAELGYESGATCSLLSREIRRAFHRYQGSFGGRAKAAKPKKKRTE
ncbi:MAG: sulfotransferase [Mariniblastus sp.]|nr:sulfotransferase [Mariniblastus sp.]